MKIKNLLTYILTYQIVSVSANSGALDRNVAGTTSGLGESRRAWHIHGVHQEPAVNVAKQNSRKTKKNNL